MSQERLTIEDGLVVAVGEPARAAAHTPGPWHFEDNQRTDDAGDPLPSAPNQVMTRDGQGICEMDPECPEHIANAHLIAAAPDLLEALKGVLAVADRKTKEFDAARAAIAKAEGREECADCGEPVERPGDDICADCDREPEPRTDWEVISARRATWEGK